MFPVWASANCVVARQFIVSSGNWIRTHRKGRKHTRFTHSRTENCQGVAGSKMAALQDYSRCTLVSTKEYVAGVGQFRTDHRLLLNFRISSISPPRLRILGNCRSWHGSRSPHRLGWLWRNFYGLWINFEIQGIPPLLYFQLFISRVSPTPTIQLLLV